MSLPVVEILLATYNGERFLHQQIDSVLAQDYPALRILASDDGSTDGTAAILADYAARDPERFQVLQGLAPTGSAQANFLRLLQHATGKYVCFCDQDDVWLPGKLSLSMQRMHALEQQRGAATPLLVFTDLRVVDQQLRTVHPSMWKSAGIDPDAAQKLRQLVARAVVTGCTMTLNRPLTTLAQNMPPEATMHDRWIALLAAAMGAAAHVSEPQVLYRQHDRNVVGAVVRTQTPSSLLRRLRNNQKRLAERRLNEHQIEALLRRHGPAISPANRTLLERYLESSRSPSALKRISLTLRYGFFRQGILSNLALLLEPFRGN